ncbi:MAG: hypothetical protein AAF471_07590, partial [Myxococcota bacterium]
RRDEVLVCGGLTPLSPAAAAPKTDGRGGFVEEYFHRVLGVKAASSRGPRKVPQAIAEDTLWGQKPPRTKALRAFVRGLWKKCG